MAGKTPYKAVRAFSQPIQAALSCFASSKVAADVFTVGPVGRLTLNRYNPVRLDGSGKVHLLMTMSYRVIEAEGDLGPYKVSTVGWIYHLLDSSKDALVGYHWHPVSESHATHPHMHNFAEGDKRHYPTGRVLVEQVLQLATEFGAKPRDPDEWLRVISENRSNFDLGASWGTSHPPEGSED